MANYVDLQTIANDAAFRGRCLYALTVQAVFTMNTGTPTPAQIAYSNVVLAGQANTYQVALTVLANPTVATNATVASLPGCTAATDAQILTAIQVAFNALAGVAV
jgi:hypothetical protein